MFLLVILLISNGLYGMKRERPLTFVNEPTALSIDVNDTPPSIAAQYVISNVTSDDDLCEAALATFMKRTDSDLAKHIKPHLKTVIKEAVSSPESEEESSSPKRIVKIWAKNPESVRTTPRPELDEVILEAIQKAFEEKESLINYKSEKIERMFSRKTTALITTVIGAVVTITSSLGSIYGTKDSLGNCNCNCTK